MKKSIWTKQRDLQSKKIKKFLDDDERAKRPKIWQTKFEKILDDDERAKRPKIWQTKFEKFWMTMSETK